MFKFNNSIEPNKVLIGWHFLSNKYAALKSKEGWLRCWTLNSRVVSSRPTLVTVHFQSLGNFVYPTLPQSTQL